MMILLWILSIIAAIIVTSFVTIAIVWMLVTASIFNAIGRGLNW